MFELLILVFALVLFSFLIVEIIGLKIKTHRLAGALLQEELDKSEIEFRLLELLAEGDSSNVEQTEGFLKFVSESRDAAFSYIEEVQESLKPLEEAIGLLSSSQIKAADRKKAILIIQNAINNLPEDL
tara:strand:+ start:182 stop:565 length:384 start_codon:yes stop_codon:yes gene_type:complete